MVVYIPLSFASNLKTSSIPSLTELSSSILQTEKDNAVERAEELQRQLTEMHIDHEKLRKTHMSNLHERVSGCDP